MKNLFMLLMLAFFSAGPSNAQCVSCPSTNSINFATGVDGSGAVLALGSFDGNWLLTNAPAAANLGTLPVLPLVIPNYIPPGGATGIWGMNSPALLGTLTANGNWISPFPTPNYGVNNPAPANPFTFTYRFCVCADDSFTFQGLLNADDWAQLNIDGTTILATANNWPIIFQYNQTVFLTAGVHTLNIDLRNLGGTAMGVNCSGTITARNGANLAVTSCCNPNGAVNGVKYNDVNSNGVIDAADTKLQGWTFNLNGPGGSFSSVTNQFGVFNFTNVPAGTYTLSEVIPPGWGAVLPAGGSTSINVTAGNVTTVNFLNVQTPIIEARGCCDSIGNSNLVTNGSFEAGNTGFTTGSYVYQPLHTPNSVSEGMYSVVTGAQAVNISNCWDIPDHTTCTAAGRFLVVNGRTHNPMISIVYQQQNIQVIPGEEYIFCMYYRHLPQCAFDVFNINNLSVFVDGASQQVVADCPEPNSCGWTKISFSFIATTPITSVSVLLDEGGIGDGNDLAFDDFSLRKKAVTPADYCHFNIATDGGSQKTITATATTALPPGFTAQWTVEELDCVTGSPIGGTLMSDPAWNPNATNFPGYCCVMGGTTPGAFFTSRCYKITRRVTSCCYVPCEDDLWVSWQQPMMMNNEREASSTGNEANGNECYISRDGINWTKLEDKNVVATDDITLFPNPGDGNVTIQSGHSLENSTLTVYSSDSKVILKQRIDGRKGSVNINNLPGGVYSFELVEADGTRTYKKYVKQ